MFPVRQSSVDHLRVAERAIASGELALARRHAALALLERSGPLPSDLWHSAVDIAVVR